MASGFRRSLARHGGRTLAALAIAAIVVPDRGRAGDVPADPSRVASTAAADHGSDRRRDSACNRPEHRTRGLDPIGGVAPDATDAAAVAGGPPALDPVRGSGGARPGPDRIHARRPGHRRLRATARRRLGGRRSAPRASAGGPPRRQRDPRPGHRRRPGSCRSRHGHAAGRRRTPRPTALSTSRRRTGRPRRPPPPGSWRARRAGHGSRDPARGRDQPARPPPRDLRLPPVLGAELELAPARLREDLDDRLLRDRCRRRGQPSEAQQDGTTTVGWSGWTSSRMTSIISAAHRQPHPGRPDGPELRLEHGGLTRQKQLLGSSTAAPTSPARSRRPSGTAAPTASTSTSSRSPGLRRRVHRARPDDPDGAEPDPPRLPDHVRHDRLDRQLPDRRRDRARAARTRSSSWATTTGRRGSSPVGSWRRSDGPATTSATRSRPTRRGSRPRS